MYLICFSHYLLFFNNTFSLIIFESSFFRKNIKGPITFELQGIEKESIFMN